MSQSVAPAGIRAQPKTLHGTEPKIQTMDPNAIRIMHRADFDYFCCTQCLYEGGNFFNLPERKYFWVLENAYEYNNPSSCLGCLGKSDYVIKYHFDKGAYSQTGCPWKSGCLKGDPSMFTNYSRCVCCCMDMPDGCNQCLNCYYPSWCGDRIMVLTSETVCCCCPTRACWCHNCCGLCGTKSGDPLPAYSFPMTYSLIPGTGIELANALDGVRNTWKARMAGGNYGLATAVAVNGNEMK